jgi:hypothetical protein
MGSLLRTTTYREVTEGKPVLLCMLRQVRFIISLSLSSVSSPPHSHHGVPITPCYVSTSPSGVPWILPGII